MRSTCMKYHADDTAAEERQKTELQKKADMAELEQMEKTIITGIETFVSVGICLAEISKRKLYKLRGFSSFGEYCEAQFNISRSHGYRQIAHAVTCQNIGENPACIPEKVIRPLTKIDDPETAGRKRKQKAGMKYQPAKRLNTKFSVTKTIFLHSCRMIQQNLNSCRQSNQHFSRSYLQMNQFQKKPSQLPKYIAKNSTRYFP